MRSTIVIIGAGHNGLVAAFYLAKAGFKPIVLERRSEVGGGAITGEVHPGFRCPTLSHDALLHQQVARDMELHRHGLEFLTPLARVCAPRLGGPPLVLYDDVPRSIESIRAFNAADADAYAAFRNAMGGVASVLASALAAPPPSIDSPTTRDLWNLIKTGRRFRAIGRRNGYRLLRWAPMAAADLVHEWFQDELLCATIAAPGVSGTMLGPWSAGSALVLMMREAHAQLAGRSLSRVRGGPGALTRALADAAASAGAEIHTRMPVDRIVVRNERATGVVAGGRDLPAAAVLSAIDPKTTFLRLIDPADLAPDFALKARNYRAAGTIAKINLALSSLPRFEGIEGRMEPISGHIHIGPEIDYLEHAFDRAKYGEFSDEPWLDVTIPSVLDPDLAPPGAHVASIYVHYAPYQLRGRAWAASRDALLAAVIRTLEPYAPGLASQVVATQLITPDDMERDYGFAGGHIFHGELAIDQLFTMRPLLGYGKYDSPIGGLFLCGAGTHPGGFLTGASGRLAAGEMARRLNNR